MYKRQILQSQALKWAFYMTLISLILFVIFRGKRTQRIIPVIDPLKNATLDFTKTIGDLYYQPVSYTHLDVYKRQLQHNKHYFTNYSFIFIGNGLYGVGE